MLSTFLKCTFWIKDFLIDGGEIGRYYREIKRIDQGSIEDIENHKKQYLNKLLNYTVANTKFYSKFENCDLSDFPIVNKQTLFDNYKDIIVPEIINPYQKGEKYHIQKTSGSTGTPFAIPQDIRKRKRRIAELKYFGHKVGFKSHDKLVHLRVWLQGQSKSKSQSFWENIVPFNCAIFKEEQIKLLCSTINKGKAVCLRGHASLFDAFAKYPNLPKLPTLKLIIAGSETLYDSTRELVKQNIGCNIISQYANEENGILAQEGVNDSMHKFYLNESGYIYEVLKFDSDEPAAIGELGRLIITDLFNYAFPIVRYDNGDSIVMDNDDNGKMYISKIYGRRQDLIYDTTGDVVYPMFLNRTLKNYDDQISQWQFIQKDKSTYQLKLLLKNTEEFTYQGEVMKLLTDILGHDTTIEVVYVDDIPVLKSGKRKSVVNEMKL